MRMVGESFGVAEQEVETDSRRGGGSGSHPQAAHRWIWASVIVFFVGGDLGTTGLGYVIPGVAEYNPSIATVVATHGFVGMLSLKVIAVLGAFLLYRVAPRPHNVAVPLGFAVVGVGVTTWNLVVLTLTVLA